MVEYQEILAKWISFSLFLRLIVLPIINFKDFYPYFCILLIHKVFKMGCNLIVGQNIIFWTIQLSFAISWAVLTYRNVTPHLENHNTGEYHRRVRATLESTSKRGSFEKIFSCQEFWNLENWKWEIENIFCIVCELKESENHLSTSFKKLWLDGWLWVGELWL